MHILLNKLFCNERIWRHRPFSNVKLSRYIGIYIPVLQIDGFLHTAIYIKNMHILKDFAAFLQSLGKEDMAHEKTLTFLGGNAKLNELNSTVYMSFGIAISRIVF